MKSQSELRDKWMDRCAWCGKQVQEEAACYGIGARTRAGFEFSGQGPLLEITLEHADKKTYGIRTAADSPAREEGWDLVFFLCSEECAEKLRAALQREIGLLGGPLERLEG